MDTVVLTLHIILALFLIGVILLQRSEGGALGIGGGGGGFMGGRSAASALTKTTVILAACFFATSITLGLMAKTASRPASSVTDTRQEQSETPVPAAPAGKAGESPSGKKGDSPEPAATPKPPASGEPKPEGGPSTPEPQ